MSNPAIATCLRSEMLCLRALSYLRPVKRSKAERKLLHRRVTVSTSTARVYSPCSLESGGYLLQALSRVSTLCGLPVVRVLPGRYLCVWVSQVPTVERCLLIQQAI